ncbi:STAS domain-containing protein [Pseudomonas oligotrophica]|uniref:STAS domain-containing protein n=1 Tax=Pseudomonas oligotrophica TaxID=2912055 RepID=UPI001F1DF19D|nr:STAS domain-containing protein [Pseudomonas oligotrophica]MCF7203520.1 STAS domain-containing protein [Pseudomonas oligotrophica]
MTNLNHRTVDALRINHGELLRNWAADMEANTSQAALKAGELQQQMTEFLRLFVRGVEAGSPGSLATGEWSEMRHFLEKLSYNWAVMGVDSQETAAFIFSLKRPVMVLLQREFGDEALFFVEQLWVVSEFIDVLAMHTISTFQKSREAVIKRQQEELLELSTPVVKLWDGILALPMIGTLDSQRTQVVMESLLQRIVDTGSQIAIIDIIGVPTVDTLVAQHLLKTVTAIRLMGADCIISGVRPQIAQTIVHLGLDLQGIVTKANLADALALALARTGLSVGRAS